MCTVRGSIRELRLNRVGSAHSSPNFPSSIHPRFGQFVTETCAQHPNSHQMAVGIPNSHQPKLVVIHTGTDGLPYTPPASPLSESCPYRPPPGRSTWGQSIPAKRPGDSRPRRPGRRPNGQVCRRAARHSDSRSDAGPLRRRPPPRPHLHAPRRPGPRPARRCPATRTRQSRPHHDTPGSPPPPTLLCPVSADK